jgi:hypothetical protein
VASASVTPVQWIWVLPALVVLGAVVVTAVALRAVAVEARALQLSLAAWDRLAVSVGDLEHDAQQAERDLRRLTRR